MSHPGPEGTSSVTPEAAAAAAAATAPPPRCVSSTRVLTSLRGSLDGKADQGKQSPTLAVSRPPARSVKSAECCCWSGQEEDDGGSSLFSAASGAPAVPVLCVSRMVQLSAEWLKVSWEIVTEGEMAENTRVLKRGQRERRRCSQREEGGRHQIAVS